MTNGILSQGSIVSQPTLDTIPTFTNGSIPIVTGWVDIAYSTELSKYVAISTTLGGQCSVATSDNGKDWSFKQNILPDCGSATWKSISYGNGIFIAVTNSTVAAYSPDSGVTWTQFTIPAGEWIKIIQGNSTFVLIPQTGIDAYTSPMSSTSLNATWVKVALSPSTSPWVDAVYGGSGLGFFVISSGTSASYSSVNGATWSSKTLPSNNTWTSIAFTSGKFVIAGTSIYTNANLTSGTWIKANTPTVDSWSSVSAGGFNIIAISTGNSNIATVSTDGGSTWLQTTLATTSNWTSVKYGSEIHGFVAISSNSSQTSVSVDGTSWSLGKMPCYAEWTGVTYNEDKFVAVSRGNNVIAVSSDALSWQHKKLSAKLDWRGMAYGNGYFVTVANSSNSVAYSLDSADTWNTLTTLPGTNNKWLDVEYGNGVFVALHETGVAVSTDNAATWTPKTLATLAANAKYNKVVFGNNIFVITSSYSNVFQVSNDNGKTWTSASVPDAQWIDIAFGDNLFVAVDNLNGTIISSVDAIVWVEKEGPVETSSIKKINFANSKFVITYSNNSTYLTSDFVTWSDPVNTEINSEASTYGKGVLLYLSNSNTDVSGILTTTTTLPFADAWVALAHSALGYIAIMKDNGIYATSANGNSWTQKNLPVSGSWNDIATNEGSNAVIIANGVKSLRSVDSGSTFTETTMPVNANWQSVAYGNSYFIAVSNGTAVAVSSNNETTWNSGASLPVSSSWKITYTGSYFLAIAATGHISKSVNNGASWTALTSLPVSGNLNVCFGNNSILVTTETSFGYLSTDAGITWTRVLMPTGYTWNAVSYGNGVFVAIAPNSDKYATSTDGIVWTLRKLLSKVQWIDITYYNGSFIAISSNATDIAKIDYPINSAVYTCPTGKTMSGKLLISFNDFDPLNSSIKTCSVRVNDMNYRLGLANNNSGVESNTTLNSLTIPLVLGSSQTLRIESANVNLEPKYILTGYEE
jgi:hypothetical protein